MFWRLESKDFSFLPSLWKSEKKNNPRCFDDCFHPQIFDMCGKREMEKTRRERERVTIHYLLLPAIITSFCELFLSPFLAPQLHSDFHFVKRKKKKNHLSCVKPLLLIKSHLRIATNFLDSIIVPETLAPGS